MRGNLEGKRRRVGVEKRKREENTIEWAGGLQMPLNVI
jgi:hypothetical protein